MPVSVFLKQDMLTKAEKAVVYDLRKEFHATTRNRGYRTYLSLAAFSVLLLGGTFGVTSYIENKNRNIAVEIADFQDINMQELLYSLRNAGKLLADMRENMAQMKGRMGLEMQRIRMKSLEEMELLRQKHNLTEAQRAELMKKLLEERERRLAQVNEEYNTRLRDKEKSIEDVKRSMNDNQVQLQEKMNTSIKSLESKLRDYQGESKEARLKADQLVKQMGENYMLKRQEERTEYEKKLKDLMAKIKKAEEDLKGSANKTKELENLLGLYRRALMHYAFMRGEQGHVVSVQKNGSLLVVLNPMVEVEKSCKGLVINKKGTVIARIEIAPREGIAKAQVIKMLSGAPINPFDMIIVQRE